MTENIAAKSFTIFISTLIIGLMLIDSAAWILAFIPSTGYAITKKKS